MFGIGFSEFLLIGLVIILFVRPDDLPAFFRKAGKVYGKARAAYREVMSVKDDFLREMDVAAALKESDTEPGKTQEQAKKEPDAESAPARDSSDRS
jgi:Sec-independent protein translocase protein TatA